MSEFNAGEILVTLDKRRRLIENFRDGTTDKRALAEQLDVSRPTVDRACRNLEEYGIISSNGTDYELTLFGKLVHDKFTETVKSIEKIATARTLFEQLHLDFSFPAGFFLEGEIRRSNPKAPAEPFQLVWNLLDGSSEFVALLPVMKAGYVRGFNEAVVEQGISGAIVIEEGIVGVLFADHGDLLTDLLEIERCSFWGTRRPIRIGLVVVDGRRLWVGFYGPAGGLRGAIVNESSTTVKWGEDQFESYRDQSDRVGTHGSATSHAEESPNDTDARNNRVPPSDVSD